MPLFWLHQRFLLQSETNQKRTGYYACAVFLSFFIFLIWETIDLSSSYTTRLAGIIIRKISPSSVLANAMGFPIKGMWRKAFPTMSFFATSSPSGAFTKKDIVGKR